MATTPLRPPVVLVAGHWLGGWAWDQVVAHLVDGGRPVVALTLPGLSADDPERTTRTLDDQAAAIVDTIRGPEIAGQGVVLVAHSGANAPVSIVLDRHPELVRRVVWVDSGPVAAGTVFAPDLPEAVTELPLPPFDVLGQQASLAGLSEADLERFRARAVPEPAAALRQAIELTNPARHRVPTTLVCCSLAGDRMLELARAGHPMFAPVTALEDLELVDLPTGHWPMWSRPRDLARVIDAAARRVS
ncbi:alpha/beta hydrolase [Nakamurella flava]|uniref:Alpha/beta hydrolase n=1 Tax=Nakamurella flava TaxID=2576308 RepID=A0A4U6QBY6_9ACTN|nr:alpha/beta fold hydrolase [Nakamurella flava]TKV57406.1 alpha/beta hydrolase [Nakamurella flava]